MPRVLGLPASPPIPPAVVLSDELSALLQPRIARLGYLGAFFAVSARQPEALAGFVRFTEALKDAVPEALGEVVALRVATALDNAYEKAQHEALVRTRGVSKGWITAASGGNDEIGALNADELIVRNLTDEVLANTGHAASDVMALAVDRFGPDLVVGIVLLISRFIAHAHAANAFALVDPRPGDGGSQPVFHPNEETT